MRFLPRFVTTALVAFALQTPAPTAQAPGTGVVAGQVRDATTGRPIGGATVTLASGASAPVLAGVTAAASARRAVAIASSDGRFVFRDLPAGSYSLTATLEGYAPGATGRRRPGGPGRSFTVTDGGRVTDATVGMWRTATISGFVRDDRGEAAIGVPVIAVRRIMNTGRYEFTFTGGGGEATDERGYYRINDLMPGAYAILIRTTTQTMGVAEADAYRAAVSSGTSAGITSDFRATGAVQVSGRGVNVGEWIVSTLSGDTPVLPGPNGTVLIHPNIFYPSARTPAEAEIIALAPGDDRSGVDITRPLVAGARITGVLTGPDGPAANHGIRLIPVSDGDPFMETPVAYSVTDAAGRFALLGVAPGNYVLRAHRVTPAGMAGTRLDSPAAGAVPIRTAESASDASATPLFAEAKVSVGSAHVDNLSLTLQPGARISGRVVFESGTPSGAKPPQVAITIRPLTGTLPSGSGQVRIDSEGFSFTGLPPGRYMLSGAAVSPGADLSIASIQVGGQNAAAQAFTLGSSDINDVVVTFTDKIMALTGTVRANDPKGDRESTVVLFPANTERWMSTGMSPRLSVSTSTTATGAYRLVVPLAGDYLVLAVPPEIVPDIDPDFVKRFSASAVRVTFGTGESKAQDLTIARIR